MNELPPFNEVMFANASGGLRLWLQWLGYSLVATPFLLLFSKATRRDALIVFLTNVTQAQ